MSEKEEENHEILLAFFANLEEKILNVDAKVETLSEKTHNVVEAFESAQGAITVLNFAAKLLKPLLVIGTAIGAFVTYLQHTK